MPSVTGIAEQALPMGNINPFETMNFFELQRVCPCCHRCNPIKDYRPRKMRWTPHGAHLLVQVRCAVLNGDILEKWKDQEKASTKPMDPEVQKFLERLQLAEA